VKDQKLSIRYIFLLRSKIPQAPELEYLNRFKEFVEEIRIVDEKGVQLPPASLRTSIVIFENQKFAFTFDRNDNMTLVEALEHVSDSEFQRLNTQYHNIEMISSLYYRRS